MLKKVLLSTSANSRVVTVLDIPEFSTGMLESTVDEQRLANNNFELSLNNLEYKLRFTNTKLQVIHTGLEFHVFK